MKNLKQLCKNWKFPILGEYTTLLVGTKKIDVKMYYTVEFDKWIPNTWKGMEGSSSNENVFTYDQLGKLLSKMQKLGATQVEITATYKNPKGSGVYVDSTMRLVFADGEWILESVEIAS